MPEPGSNRSLTRWSLIVFGVIVVLVVLYYLTGGFGAAVPVKP